MSARAGSIPRRPYGATLAFAAGSPTTVSFPSTEANEPATPVAISLVNTGNGPATVHFGTPGDSEFSLSGGGGIMNAGDTLTARCTVIDKRTSRSRPGLGFVKIRSELLNQRGEQVFELENTGMFLTREAAQ